LLGNPIYTFRNARPFPNPAFIVILSDPLGDKEAFIDFCPSRPGDHQRPHEIECESSDIHRLSAKIELQDIPPASDAAALP
jgi:hypothetical protein